MDSFKIRLSDFPESNVVNRTIEGFTDADTGYQFCVSVFINAIKVSDDNIYLRGNIEGWADLECSNCLEPYKHKIDIKIDSDVDVVGGEIDAADEVRQLLILETPSKPECSQDCLGICKICGKVNKKGDECSCDKNKDESVAQRWKEILNKGLKNNRRK